MSLRIPDTIALSLLDDAESAGFLAAFLAYQQEYADDPATFREWRSAHETVVRSTLAGRRLTRSPRDRRGPEV